MTKIQQRKLKTAYSRTRIVTKTSDTKTKCVQSEKRHCDINHIVSKAMQTGQLPTLMGREPIQTMPDVETYQDALNKVVLARQAFERLPSNIRDEFSNDPVKLLQAVEESKTNKFLKTQLQNFGILDTPQPVNPPPAEPTTNGSVPEGNGATE